MNCQRSPCRRVPRSLRQWDPNRRAQEREHAIAQAAENAKRAEVERKAIAEAEGIVAIWNARQAGGRALWFYPTIGAALAAGLPWLTFSCPACVAAALGAAFAILLATVSGGVRQDADQAERFGSGQTSTG
jgi:hypothetical protein